MKGRSSILERLKTGATIITPNNRLAGELLDVYAHSGAVQDKPHCLPYQTWLNKLYHTHSHCNAHSNVPVLLTAPQLRYLWIEILSQAKELSLNQGLIVEIQDSWSHCLRWMIDFFHPAFFLTPQTRQFQQWAEQLQSRLDELGAITEDQLVPFFLHQQNPVKSSRLIWYCFDDYTPQQQALQHYLQQAGCLVEHIDHNNTQERSNETTLYAAKDEDDEYKQLHYWICERLKRGEQRIGIVVPDLANQAHKIQRLLQQPATANLFNISLGQTLYDFSITSHALCWLKLNGKTLSHHEARLLLYSPFLAHSCSEMAERMQALQDCRALQETVIDQSFFLTELALTTPKLVSLIKMMNHYPKNASVDEWIEAFTERLATLGFPGDTPLNSASWQCYHRLLALFDEFRALGFVTPTLSKEKALSLFESLAKTTIFQPKSGHAANIWVLGLLEASGCLFDNLWVTGMTDECLPPKTRLSAFIPPELQRQFCMPHASPERELFLARTIVTRLKNSSPDCVFSYPQLIGEKPNLPSPLVRDLRPHVTTTPASELSELALEYYHEPYQPDVSSLEQKGGGAALLANQAKCPFRAFAAHRLHVKQSVVVSDGPNASERGQIIHKVLELLWQSLQSQQALLAMPTQTLDSLITSTIETVLAPYSQLRKHSFPAAIKKIEINRLKRLVQACLAFEKTRPYFEIEALEQAFSCTIGGIDLNLRIDRLDSVALGKKWVIDYKSSLPATLPWKEDRPKEPQLLLYALLDEHISALVFAGLKEGQLSIKGLSEEPLELDGVNTLKKDENWHECRNKWRQQLEELAAEYQQGYCLPKPASPAVCQQCDFQSLCRFHVQDSVF